MLNLLWWTAMVNCHVFIVWFSYGTKKNGSKWNNMFPMGYPPPLWSLLYVADSVLFFVGVFLCFFFFHYLNGCWCDWAIDGQVWMFAMTRKLLYYIFVLKMSLVFKPGPVGRPVGEQCHQQWTKTPNRSSVFQMNHCHFVYREKGW